MNAGTGTLLGIAITAVLTFAGTYLTARKDTSAEKIKSLDARLSEAFDAKDQLLSDYRQETTRLRSAVEDMAETIADLRDWILLDSAWHAQVTAELRRLGGEVPPSPAPPARRQPSHPDGVPP